jgi:HSP20 family molecular chaperone IbpA
MARLNDLDNFMDVFGPSVRNILTRTTTNMRTGHIPVDIVNEENTIYIYAEIPAVNKENIDIDVFNNKLTIIAEKIKTYENPSVSEIRFGRFERTLNLPICITRKDTVSVTYTNGILKIKINKLVEEENKFSIKPTD